MKHIFVLNPAAGNGKLAKALHPKIIDICKKNNVDYEIHRTVSLGDARNYTKKRCDEIGDIPIRFYSCGGDGTVNEVLNGLAGIDGVELAVIPVGTGDDFVRNFSNRELFLDLEAQFHGETKKIDAIEYEFLELSDEEKEEYEEAGIKIKGHALNMFNFGFDAQAVSKASHYKKMPLMSGTMSYIAGVLNVLAKMRSINMTIEFGDGEVKTEDFLMIGITNGRFSGGGFDGSPQARINDGLLDITTVKKVTRRFFLSFIKSYHDGTHIDNPKVTKIYSHYQCKEAVLKPVEKVIMAIDGETVVTGPMKFTVKEKLIDLVIPQGVEFLN